MGLLLAIFAVLSVWDYPARQPAHDRLRAQFVAALRGGDTATMEETCRKGVALLPDDPTWHYNLACSLAYFKNRGTEALDELETAIDLGFRDVEQIKADRDLKRLEALPRYKALVEHAEFMKTRPVLTGPLSTVRATGIFGTPIVLGEQNLGWDFDLGCFDAKMALAAGSVTGHTGDLYMNRDGNHARIQMARFPGLTEVKFDQEGRRRKLDQSIPNVLFPYPVFGNCSQAFVAGPFWRSIPRALMTRESGQLKKMVRFYLNNQVWVFPSNCDTRPVGTNDDVFASLTPYWVTTAGRSWSDLPYLNAALAASGAFRPSVKREIVRRNLLAPTVMTLMRKSLRDVKGEADYLSPRAHPTAFPPNGMDTNRLVAAAAKLTADEIMPLAVISVEPQPVAVQPVWPELTYATGFAWAYVLRADEETRTFTIHAKGSAEYAFVQTHGAGVKAVIEKLSPDSARVTFPKSPLNPTNRLDIAVFGRNPGTDWGAPSYVSFARMDPSAPYSDPFLTPQAQPAAVEPKKQ